VLLSCRLICDDGAWPCARLLEEALIRESVDSGWVVYHSLRSQVHFCTVLGIHGEGYRILIHERQD
jgi:hypothetical protein